MTALTQEEVSRSLAEGRLRGAFEAPEPHLEGGPEQAEVWHVGDPPEGPCSGPQAYISA